VGKYTFLLIKILLFTTFLVNSQKILGNDELNAVDLNKIENTDAFEAKFSKENKVRDWIELFKKEIRNFNPNEIEVKEEIKVNGTMESKKSKERIIDEIGTGLSDKGMYLDFLKNSNSKNKFGIRVNYLPEDFFTHQDIYVDDTNVKAEYFGIGMLYKHYLFPEESRSNFYLQANADISTFKLSHEIDLTKQTYTDGNLQVTCSACGILTIQTDPDKVHIIPTISFGYQYKNTPNFRTNLSIGVQYIDFGSLDNFTNTEYNLPSYVQTRVDKWVQKSQNKIDNYSEFQPSINLGFSYVF